MPTNDSEKRKGLINALSPMRQKGLLNSLAAPVSPGIGGLLNGQAPRLPYGVVTPEDIARSKQTSPNSWVRSDGSPKGQGWLGLMRDKSGRIESERSISQEFDGREIEFPLFVPTLSHEEVSWLLNNPEVGPGEIPPNITNKAAAHAFEMMRKGLRPYATY